MLSQPRGKFFYAYFLLTTVMFFACGEKAHNVDELILHFRESYTHEDFSISPDMASIFIDEEKPGGNELKAVLDSVSKMEVLFFSNSEQTPQLTLDINQRLKRQGLLHYGNFSSSEERLSVWILRTKNLVNDLVVVISVHGNVYLVHLAGNVPLERVDKLIKPANRSILDYLYRINS